MISESLKFTNSDGEQAETIHWISTSFACEYVAQETHDWFVAQYEQLGKMLGTMIRDAEQWTVR
ncbi:MAG: four helix bundle protein [Desulfovermiculus sp.]